MFTDPFGLRPNCPPHCLGEAANFAAGFGDAITFGLTDVVRDAIGANGAVDKESGVYLAGEVAGAATSAALGGAAASAIRNGRTMATSGAARSLATEALTSKPGQALFGKGGVLNSGSEFRIGVSRANDGGRFAFRAAGNVVEKAAGTSKIDLVDLGKISDFVSAIGR